MSPSEIADRARATLAHGADAAIFRAAPRAWRARWEPDAGSLLRSSPSSQPVGFLRPDRIADLRERLPSEAEALVARADRLLADEVQFFGYPPTQARAARRHDLDPFTGRRWPPRHAKRVDYRHGAPGDPKWIWELNRCQDLPVLVAAWHLTGETPYAREASARLAAWIAAHPPGRGIAWSSGFEAGIRAISLAATIDALRGSDLMPREQEYVALRALWQHSRWIERDPATGSSANNHRIGELVGLVVVGSLAPELADADRWLETGLAALSHEVELQIRADGTSAEQAFSYHVFVVDLLLVATAALDCAGQAVPPSIAAAIERSGDALWAQLGQHEPAPTYGDTDDGRAIVLDGLDLRDPRGAAAGIAARFEHADCARASGGLDTTALLLFGREGAVRFDHIGPAAGPGSVLLRDSGLAILRSERRRATLDFGPHGHLSIAAHAHADALRVDVSLGATQLVVDPGVGSYFARPELREAFRSTGFHATVTVDGVSSSVSGGPFLWTRHARSRLLAADLEDGVVVAEHDGYMRLEDPVLHRRALVLVGDAILVVDRLEARDAHRYSQRWPLHPELELQDVRDDRVSARSTAAGVALAFAANRPAALTTARGAKDPVEGWWSARLESVVPSWLVSSDVEATGAVEMATLVVPFDSQSVPEVAVGLEQVDGRSRVSVKTALVEDVVELELASSVPSVRRVAQVGSR